MTARASRRGRPLWWTSQRIWQLAELIEHGHSDDEIARRMGTTATAVHLARKRHRLKPRRRALLSGREVARRLGIGCEKTVTRWIERGELRGRRGQQCGPNRQWYVTEGDFLAFLEDERCWHLWQPERIPNPGLRQWALELRGHVRYLTLGEVAVRCYVEHATVNEWIHRGELRAVRNGNWLVREDWLAGFVPPNQRSKRGMRRRTITPEVAAQVVALRAQGLTWTQIATRLGIGVSTAHRIGTQAERRVA